MRTCLVLAVVLAGGCPGVAWSSLPADGELDALVIGALVHADQQLRATVAFLETVSDAEPIPARRPHFPTVTENLALNPGASRPDGQWQTSRADGSFWARGSFAAQLWMMAAQAEEPADQAQWQEWARRWTAPIVGYTGSDMTVNNLAVGRRWYQQATDPVDRAAARDSILLGARRLATPYVRAGNTGSFHEDIGAMGYSRRSDTTGETWFHAFIDHSPNVEQLLAASWLTDDAAEAVRFRDVAVRHVRTLHGTLGPRRNPGTRGSWQRAYFDWEPTSPTYGQFLFNEAKQGWTAASTWSRGQAWWVYASALAYFHTRLPDLRTIAVEAALDYAERLPDRYPGDSRLPGIFVPAWDFDYALEVDAATDYDTSAAAMAVNGLLHLLVALGPDDPVAEELWTVVRGTLANLSAPPFLTSDGGPEMSILRHGSYHHWASTAPSQQYRNGLIWGDYFFVDALVTYQSFRSAPAVVTVPPTLALADNQMTWWGEPGQAYQLEATARLGSWQEADRPQAGGGQAIVLELAPAEPLSDRFFYRVRTWILPETWQLGR